MLSPGGQPAGIHDPRGRAAAGALETMIARASDGPIREVLARHPIYEHTRYRQWRRPFLDIFPVEPPSNDYDALSYSKFLDDLKAALGFPGVANCYIVAGLGKFQFYDRSMAVLHDDYVRIMENFPLVAETGRSHFGDDIKAFEEGAGLFQFIPGRPEDDIVDPEDPWISRQFPALKKTILKYGRAHGLKKWPQMKKYQDFLVSLNEFLQINHYDNPDWNLDNLADDLRLIDYLIPQFWDAVYAVWAKKSGAEDIILKPRRWDVSDIPADKLLAWRNSLY